MASEPLTRILNSITGLHKSPMEQLLHNIVTLAVLMLLFVPVSALLPPLIVVKLILVFAILFLVFVAVMRVIFSSRALTITVFGGLGLLVLGFFALLALGMMVISAPPVAPIAIVVVVMALVAAFFVKNRDL